MSQSPKRTGQSGAAQVWCMARSARRWSADANRLARPTSTTLPSPSNTTGMMSASHASRRTVAGGRGWPSYVSHTPDSWTPLRKVSRSMSTSSSAGRRPPTVGVAVTIAMNASAFNWSNVRPLSGLAFSAATAASNAADNLASASGSRLIWVWHMPSRSIHRRTVRCDRSFSWWRRPSSREMRRASSRTLRANVSTDVVAASLDQARRLRRQLDPLLGVETVGRSGDRVRMTRRHHARSQRGVHLGHRCAHRGPLGDHIGLA